MRILLATESYYPNIDGGAVAQHHLAKKLAEYGHEVRVIAPGLTFKNNLEQDDSTTIFRTKGLTLPLYMNNRYHFSPSPIFQVEKIIKTLK